MKADCVFSPPIELHGNFNDSNVLLSNFELAFKCYELLNSQDEFVQGQPFYDPFDS